MQWYSCLRMSIVVNWRNFAKNDASRMKLITFSVDTDDGFGDMGLVAKSVGIMKHSNFFRSSRWELIDCTVISRWCGRDADLFTCFPGSWCQNPTSLHRPSALALVGMSATTTHVGVRRRMPEACEFQCSFHILHCRQGGRGRKATHMSLFISLPTVAM